MNPRTTRILKEARALFWPWCAVACAGLLPLVQPSHRIVEPIGFIGFLVGIPLLAALSFGAEFQHRTLPLLLTQPVDRMEIWGEKLSLTAVAVLSALLVFFLGWRTELQPDPQDAVVAGAWIIASAASAPFWTLFARSTLGGLALINVVPGFIVMAWASLPERMRETAYLSLATSTGASIAAFVALGYAVGMLWLGRRTLARLQVTGGMAGDDLLMAGPSVMPEALAGLFRSRPTGPVFNLIRKELRLLRPLWLISLLSVLGWTCVTLLGWLPEPGPTSRPKAVVGVLAVFQLLIAILAGSLSLGEERISGTHAWHLTLPVSAGRQWLIKLSVALFTGPVCAVLLPVLVVAAGGFLSGSPLWFLSPKALGAWLLAALLLSMASFWCACAVNGTVRAVLWMFPMLGGLLYAGVFGGRVAQALMDLVVSRFDLFADFAFTNTVSNIQLYFIDPPLVATFLLVPALLVGVIQSYRLFRAHLQDSTLSVIRYLLPLAVVASLCSFFLVASDSLVIHAKQQMWTLFRETHEALERVQPGTPNLDAAHPLQLTAEDLAKASPLSERTQRWLGNSRITVAPDHPHSRPYCCGGNSRVITFAPGQAYSWYLATLHLPDGSSCTVSFQGGRGHGILGGVCR